MTEWKLFEDKSYVSTFEFHKDREAAPHIDQEWHQPRMKQAYNYVYIAAEQLGVTSVVDLGCGDGGLLSILSDIPTDNGLIRVHGFDFMPKNIDYAVHIRNVDARFANFLEDDNIEYADLAIATETIEHLEDPYQFLTMLSSKVKYLICSSPSNENDSFHCPEHAWAWDTDGYQEMLRKTGWKILHWKELFPFQIYLCESISNEAM